MFRVGIPILVILIVMVVYFSTKTARVGHAFHSKSSEEVSKPDTSKIPLYETEAGLEQRLDRWVRAGLISSTESKAILDFEAQKQPVPPAALRKVKAPGARRIPATAEALGYLGGVLVTVGLVLVATKYWPNMSVAIRLVLSGVVSALLIAAGAAVRGEEDRALARFRWFLWLASSATTGLFAWIFSREQLQYMIRSSVLITASAIVVESGVLWNRRSRPIQQIVFLGALATTAGAAAATVFPGSEAGPSGIAVWVVGLAFAVIGFKRYIVGAIMTESLGAVALVVGSALVTTRWHSIGLVFQLANSLGLIAIAVIPQILQRREDQIIAGIIGLVAAFMSLPATLSYFADQAGILTGAITWIAGACLIAASSKRLVRVPQVAKVAGGAMVIGGSALTGAQSQDVAPILGLLSSIGLIILGTRPGQVLLSAAGSVGILINVIWGISWFFPSEGRAPLLMMISGILVIAIAVWMTRMRGRFRAELGPEFRHRRKM